MSDVAARAGVSAKTVSNVLSGYPFIRDETRARVLAAVDELGYQMNVSARSLKVGRTGIIALAIPEVTQPYFAELAEAVMAVAEVRGMTVAVELTRGSRDREIAVLTSQRRRVADGLIINPLCLDAEVMGVVAGSGPTVVLGERLFSGPVDNVVMPNADGSAAAVQHLLDAGCRRIATVGRQPGPHRTTAALREEGFRRAMRGARVKVDPRLQVPSPLWDRPHGAAAVQHLLDAGHEFDGVFCFNDGLALGALHALVVAGVKVPEEVKVIGFDDTEDARFASPALSSVAAGTTQIAEHAVMLLEQRWSEPDREGREVALPHEVKVRRSTDPAAPDMRLTLEDLRSRL